MQPQGVRVRWEQVPVGVRDQIAAAMGSPVTRADNQPGGFSPGIAARCQLADGRRCFIKAVSPDQNPDSPTMHRREARITAALPAGLPVPRLVEVLDDGHWVVLVFEEIEGTTPDLPWSIPTLRAAFRALDALADGTTPCPLPDLPSFGALQEPVLDGYRTLAAGGPAADRIDPWSRRHLEALAVLEGQQATAAAGDSLLHADLRADNLLVRSDGTIVVVDWPNACTGAAWVDKVLMLPSVGLEGGPAPMVVEEALAPFAGIEADAVDCVLAALAGYFTFQGIQPDPPGLPTLRSFQRAQGAVARDWLAARRGWT